MTPAASPTHYPEAYAALPLRAVVVAGPPGAEKTALMGHLCAWFEAEGLGAAVLVRTETADPGDEGKDTWRFRAAGAAVVALAGPGELQLTVAGTVPPSLLQALSLLACRARVVLVDGWEAAPLPAILVGRTARDAALLKERDYAAVVSDLDLDWPGPWFRPDEITELGRFLAECLELT